MPELIIPETAFTTPLTPLTTVTHHVRLIMILNNDVMFKAASVEGAPVTKWIFKNGLLFWENPNQPVEGTLDIGFTISGGVNGAASLVTLCDGKKVGTINLNIATGPTQKLEHYNV